MQLYSSSVRTALLAAVFCGSAFATLIGSDYSGNLYDVNLLTGAATGSRATGITNLAGIAFNSSGTLYGLGLQFNLASLYRINPVTGASVLIGSSPVLNPFTDNFGEGDLRFAANGTLFGIDYVTVPSPPPAHQLFTINPTNGALSDFTNLPCFNNSCVVDYSAMAADTSGRLYLLDTASSDPFGHLVVANSSPYSLVGDVRLSQALGSCAGMDFDPSSGALYVADGCTGGGSLYTLNSATGALTVVGSLGLSNGLSGLAFTPSVPEPTSVLLFLLGSCLAAAGASRRVSGK